MKIKLKPVWPIVFLSPIINNCKFNTLINFDIYRFDLDRLRCASPHKDEKKIARYLMQEKGFLCAVFSGIYDPYTECFISGADGYTDGVWYWEVSLAYFVLKYHIHLPKLFLQHMESNEWNSDLARERANFNQDCPYPHLFPERLLSEREIDQIIDSHPLSRDQREEYRIKFYQERKRIIDLHNDSLDSHYYLCEISDDYYQKD